jgi:hypothetical protein
MHLTQLPAETIHNILSLVEPEDLSPIAQTCRFLNDFVKGNNALCRDIYLRILVRIPHLIHIHNSVLTHIPGHTPHKRRRLRPRTTRSRPPQNPLLPNHQSPRHPTTVPPPPRPPHRHPPTKARRQGPFPFPSPTDYHHHHLLHLLLLLFISPNRQQSQ